MLKVRILAAIKDYSIYMANIYFKNFKLNILKYCTSRPYDMIYYIFISYNKSNNLNCLTRCYLNFYFLQPSKQLLIIHRIRTNILLPTYPIVHQTNNNKSTKLDTPTESVKNV